MRIIFFNHYHRGDIFTTKEYIRHLMQLMPDSRFEYWHFNHPKLILDVNIPLTNLPNQLDHKVQFYEQGEVLAINTWVGAWWDIFAKNEGANFNTFHDIWTKIFEKVNLKVRDSRESYIPRTDYSFYNVKNVDEYLSKSNKKRILICNGKAMSGQSFDYDMSDYINTLAPKFEDIDFICTKKFSTNALNVLFTDDIIQDKEEFFNGVMPYWVDTKICDLNEISYLSTKCDAIIGKNSGPSTFCSTFDNLNDPTKLLVSFNKTPKEGMVFGVDIKIKYKHVTDFSECNIYNTLEWVINETKT